MGPACKECGDERRRLPKPGQSAAELHPEIVSLLHPDSDADLLKLKQGSAADLHWLCAEGHDWWATVTTLSRGHRCPYCARQKVWPTESLLALHPEVAAELHPDCDLDLEAYLPGSFQDATWLCPKGHAWASTIRARIHDNARCPQCFRPNDTSWTETYVMVLIGMILDMEVERDAYIEDRRHKVDGFVDVAGGTAVEYDGVYWHSLPGGPAKDARKNTWVTEHGYRVVRVRPYPLEPVTGAECVTFTEPTSREDMATAAARIIAPAREPRTITEAMIAHASAVASGLEPVPSKRLHGRTTT